jgi:tetratricopeptide (TPR) repeat protein
MIYLNNGNVQKAEELLKICIDKNQHFTLAYANYGDILYSQGAKKEALYYYLKGLETSFIHPGLTLAVAHIYLEQKDIPNFISTIADFIKANTMYILSLGLNKEILNKNIDYDVAINIYNKFMKNKNE